MPASAVQRSPSPSPNTGPFFLVGQDAAGHWLAVETHGFGGGLFASRDAAVAYVRREAGTGAPGFRISEMPIDLAFPTRST